MSTPAGALLIVDAQQGLLEGKFAIPDADEVADRLAVALAAARASGALVVYLQNDGAPGTIDEPGTTGWFIHSSVAPKAHEVVLRKSHDDGFEGTSLETVLARHHINRIAVAGLLSEMCVSATVRGALMRGIEVVLLHDAHGTYDLEDIPSSTVARVAEHALGDEVEIVEADSIVFNRMTDAPGLQVLD